MSHPGTDEAELYRRQIWYFNVKERSGLSDYQLSTEFDLDVASRSNRKAGKARRRIFERLRKFDEMPFRGRVQDFVHLVDKSSKYPVLHGTAELYLSQFWDLLGKKHLSPTQLRRLIINSAQCMQILGKEWQFRDEKELQRSMQGLSLRDQFITLAPSEERYRDALNKVLLKCGPNLASLAFIGGLYREAYFAGQLKIALMLEGKFGNLMQAVTDRDWVPNSIKAKLFDLAIQRVLTIKFPVKLGATKDVLSGAASLGYAFDVLLSRHDQML